MNKSRLKKRRHYVLREKRHQTEYDNVLREIAVMRTLRHRHVVRLHEVFDDEERDRLYMLLDLMPGGQLAPSQQRITPLALPHARACVRDIASGLAYLHAHNVVHRDIKPANILRSSDAPDAFWAIGDFGVSFVCEGGDDAISGNVGTLPFKPPEAHSTSGGTFSGKAADVWSLGVTLFQMIYGDLPYYAPDPLDFGAAVRDDPLILPAPLPDSRVDDLLRRLLTKEPAQRITAAEVLAHPWLHDADAAASLDPRGPAHSTSPLSLRSEDISRALRAMLPFGAPRLPPQPAQLAHPQRPVDARGEANARGRCGSAVAADGASPVRLRVWTVVVPRRTRRAPRAPCTMAPAAGAPDDDSSGYEEDDECSDVRAAEPARQLLLGARVRVAITVEHVLRRAS